MSGRTLPGPPQVPEGRYGRRRRAMPRWVPVVLGVLVVAAAAAAAVIGYRNLGSPPIQGESTGFEVLGAGAVRITFEVVRDDPARPAVCILRSRSEDGDETGRKEVFVPPGDDTQIGTSVVRTSRRPVTGEVFGCSYNVPPYLGPDQAEQQSTPS